MKKLLALIALVLLMTACVPATEISPTVKPPTVISSPTMKPLTATPTKTVVPEKTATPEAFPKIAITENPDLHDQYLIDASCDFDHLEIGELKLEATDASGAPLFSMLRAACHPIGVDGKPTQETFWLSLDLEARDPDGSLRNNFFGSSQILENPAGSVWDDAGRIGAARRYIGTGVETISIAFGRNHSSAQREMYGAGSAGLTTAITSQQLADLLVKAAGGRSVILGFKKGL